MMEKILEILVIYFEGWKNFRMVFGKRNLGTS